MHVWVDRWVDEVIVGWVNGSVGGWVGGWMSDWMNLHKYLQIHTQIFLEIDATTHPETYTHVCKQRFTSSGAAPGEANTKKLAKLARACVDEDAGRQTL